MDTENSQKQIQKWKNIKSLETIGKMIMRKNGKFLEPMERTFYGKKKKKKEHRELQSFVFQRVCQALTDAKIPFEMVWCERQKFSNVRVSFIVKGIKYVREIKRKKRE